MSLIRFVTLTFIFATTVPAAILDIRMLSPCSLVSYSRNIASRSDVSLILEIPRTILDVLISRVVFCHEKKIHPIGCDMRRTGTSLL